MQARVIISSMGENVKPGRTESSFLLSYAESERARVDVSLVIILGEPWIIDLMSSNLQARAARKGVALRHGLFLPKASEMALKIDW